MSKQDCFWKFIRGRNLFFFFFFFLFHFFFFFFRTSWVGLYHVQASHSLSFSSDIQHPFHLWVCIDKITSAFCRCLSDSHSCSIRCYIYLYFPFGLEMFNSSLMSSFLNLTSLHQPLSLHCISANCIELLSLFVDIQSSPLYIKIGDFAM